MINTVIRELYKQHGRQHAQWVESDQWNSDNSQNAKQLYLNWEKGNCYLWFYDVKQYQWTLIIYIE